ncbi:uncharacterized protein METZ01_LOCUS199930 [marine metagenome]|uniref:Uncharacterized protein n=1 Tax=marine metagenome TaxID=408172 RepID=A0A382E8H0_9ZZZZ
MTPSLRLDLATVGLTAASRTTATPGLASFFLHPVIQRTPALKNQHRDQKKRRRAVFQGEKNALGQAMPSRKNPVQQTVISLFIIIIAKSQERC